MNQGLQIFTNYGFRITTDKGRPGVIGIFHLPIFIKSKYDTGKLIHKVLKTLSGFFQFLILAGQLFDQPVIRLDLKFLRAGQVSIDHAETSGFVRISFSLVSTVA